MESTRQEHPGLTTSSELIGLGLWFGLLTGIAEVAVLAVSKFGLNLLVHKGFDAAWTIPLADAVLFVLVGCGYAVVARYRPRLFTRQLAVFGFAFLSGFSVLFMFAPQLHKYAAMVMACGLAVQASRAAASRRFDVVRRRTLKGMLAFVPSLALGTKAMSEVTERTAIRKLPTMKGDAPPNVLLIVLDTVRATNMSVYGYERVTTPNLDRWSREGVRFERAIAAAPWTLASHASMFTGRFPHELSADWLVPLDARYPTLAEFYSRNGYHTGGFVANVGYCTREFGLSRGFMHYEDYKTSAG